YFTAEVFRMNCHEFDKIALMLARNKLPDVAIREQALNHADGCAWCSERLEEEKELTAGVKAGVAEIALREAPPHVEEALLGAFGDRVAAANSPAVIPTPIRSWHSMHWRLEAVAAMILISASVIFWQHFRSPDQTRGSNTTAPSPSTSADRGG